MNRNNRQESNTTKFMNCIRFSKISICVIAFIFLTTLVDCSSSKENKQYEYLNFDTTEFYDSAHHWYDINDEEKIINPDSLQKRYSSSDLIGIADNILLFQKSNGGWPKNYDMQAILTDEQKSAVLKSKDELNTTFDNGATHSQLNYLVNGILCNKD